MASSARLPAINNMGIEGAFLYDGIPAVLVETPEKTASVAFMADAWPGRVDADQYRIGVAVHAHFAHLQRVAAQFPFAPEFVPRTVFFFNDTATTEIYTLSLHDALPI